MNAKILMDDLCITEKGLSLLMSTSRNCTRYLLCKTNGSILSKSMQKHAAVQEHARSPNWTPIFYNLFL